MNGLIIITVANGTRLSIKVAQGKKTRVKSSNNYI